MREGRYVDAWAMEAATIAGRDPATRDDPALPYHRRWVWDGRPVEGRDVLVRCYHGLGDTIQFARYLPVLAARARSVTVEVQARLIPLLRGLGADRLHPFDVADPLKPSECDVGITELPGALRVAPDALAAPYLAWDAAELPPGTIGLCATAGDWDADRSIPDERFRPIAERFPTFVLTPGETMLPCLNPEGCPFDMGATAALVAGAELVLTVDTMIAHLAGAMGRPVWLLLKSDPDWRWDPAAGTSAWYPSMRLHAQPRPGDWNAVLASVERDLSRWSAQPWPA